VHFHGEERSEENAMAGFWSEQSSLEYWRLADALSLQQAAVLVVGGDPSTFNPSDAPSGFEAVRSALAHAVRGKRLSAHLNADEEGHYNIDDVTILVDDLRAWLKSRGFIRGFFFPEPQGPADLARSHPHYSRKLEAAINAWKAVSENEELRRGKTVKQALEVWLRQHAGEYGLTKEDGNPNETGIQEIAKIANWDTMGGAPKTPGAE
jgi:hypothetical protein